MTKEKLKQEVQEWWYNNFEIFCLTDGQLDRICIDLLEPREKRIEELEKENKEVHINWLKVIQENAELKAVERMALYSRMSDQLIKAKELLNEFMRISKASDEDFEHDYTELIEEAEQFIKELEK